ncbi:MAG: hypothetical protein ACAH59_01090 [Pseudobdellovibrionaceae bacterium]
MILFILLSLCLSVQAQSPSSSDGDKASILKFSSNSKKYSLDLSKIQAKDRENQSNAEIGSSWSIQKKAGESKCTLSVLDSQEPRRERLPSALAIQTAKWTVDSLNGSTTGHTLLFQWISESPEMKKRMKKSGQIAHFLPAREKLSISLTCDSFSSKLSADAAMQELSKKLKATGLDAFVQLKGI